MINTPSIAANILIVDDHQLYLDGLEMLLSQSLLNAEIHKAGSVDQAIQILQNEDEFDLILLDLNLNKTNGFTLCEQSLFNSHPIAILSASENKQDIQQAQAFGLLGFLNKSCANDQLINDLQRLLAGERVFPQQATTDVLLTPRQQDVLNLLAQGYPNKVICKQLGLSEATIKTHLRALFNILDVHTRTQCVNVARENNLI